MKHIISDDRKKLTIEITEAERAELRELEQSPEFLSDKSLYEFLEPLICNSELEWMDASITGDLTSAPMLGIFGETIPADKKKTVKNAFGFRVAGCWGGQVQFDPIIERWAYMDYQVRSPLQDLVINGKCHFIA